MDEIKTRLRETADTCFRCYESWRTNVNDTAAREALQEAVHELRKVASRLEIELAVSERDELALRPIPIPPHRDAQRRGRPHEDRDNMGNDENGPGNRQFGNGPQGGGRDRNGDRAAGLRRRMNVPRREDGGPVHQGHSQSGQGNDAAPSATGNDRNDG